MQTKLSKKLYQKTFKHYDNFKDESGIRRGHPILYFGDLKNYFKQEFKVITVGVNPSSKEFDEERFPKYRKTPYSLEYAQNEYFTLNPYSWFSHYEKLLSHLGYSYGGKINKDNKRYKKAIHTDYITPLTTEKQWSSFSKQNIDLAEKIKQEGFEIWKDLINELKPDLIIYATNIKSDLKSEMIKKLKYSKVRELVSINKNEKGELRTGPFTFCYGNIEIHKTKYDILFGGGLSTQWPVPVPPLELDKSKLREVMSSLNYI